MLSWLKHNNLHHAWSNVAKVLPETRSVSPTPSSLSPTKKDFRSTTRFSLNPTPSSSHLDILAKGTLPMPTFTPTNLGEPTVNVQPTSVSLPANVTFIFVCTISFDDSPLSIEWHFNSASLPSNAAVSSISPKISQLEIEGTQQENAGLYYCTATFSNGKTATSSTNLMFIQTN